MAYQIAQTISDPGTAPQRTDPDNFDTRADAFLTVLSLWGAATTGELIVLTAQMNALSTAVDGYSTDAETAQTAAEAAQAAAIAASGATEWLIGTTYDDGDVTWGSDSKTYRAAQGSNTGHDPVGDDGTWWVQISGAEVGANSDITSMTGLSDDGIPHAKIADLQGNKNAIINGDFNIWQRGTSFAAIANGNYHADRFTYFLLSTAVTTVSRDTDVPTQSESGHKSNYSMKLDVTTADASIASNDRVAILQNIEGYNFAPFVGKTATLSFWVKAVKTGIYCVAFTSSTGDRSYVAEYTINSASTWEKKTVTLTFDYSGGTWDYTNGIGLHISWTIAMGSDFQGVADTWNSAQDWATSNQVNGVDSTDNNFWLAQVQLELGSTATDFEYRQYGDELAKCQRYYSKSYDYDVAPGTADTDGSIYSRDSGNTSADFLLAVAVKFPMTMRAQPTMVVYDEAGTSGKVTMPAGSVNATAARIGFTGAYVSGVNGAATGDHSIGFHYTADSEL